ncbi:hypothetical protein K4K59_009416 [Colletotrichum sp. SAR11_240]|nr:hypothetical protein K4K59_009416 [Colletotrichum sp. SAR11_240]
MMKTLWEVNGVMGSFRTHQELHDDDDDRMASLEYLKPVVSRSHEAIQIIKGYINSGRRERFLQGVKFDKKLKLALKSLDDASKLFSMALVSNQQTIVQQVNKYVKTIGDDVKEVQAAQIIAQQDHAYNNVIGWLDAKSDNNLNSQVHERNVSARDAGSGSDYVKTEEKNLSSLAETARLILKHGNGCGKDNGALAATDRVSIHYFLDGVDEEKGADAAKTIIELLHGLDEDMDLPVVQKIWISSRRTNILERCLEGYMVINVDDHGKADVEDFLIRTVPKFDENWQRDEVVEGKPVGEWVLQELQAKAKGNFLYAKLMVEWLKDGVFTIDDVAAFIKSRVPNHFSEMYNRIFGQYQEEQHKYIR